MGKPTGRAHEWVQFLRFFSLWCLKHKYQLFVPGGRIHTNCSEVVLDRRWIRLVLRSRMSYHAHVGYGPYVAFENGRKVLYLQVLRAVYRMLDAALIWYCKLCDNLEGIGFVFNPCDPCVANCFVKGSQQSVRFHVDDLKSSHLSPRVNNLFLVWLNKLYGSHGEVTATRGKVHEYLGMNFNYSSRQISM